MRTGIFGGSFNPPHVAHLIIAELAAEAHRLDRVLWIPTANPPHKPSGGLASGEHRFEMVHRAIQGNPSFDLSDIELRRDGHSYSIDTIRLLKTRAPGDEFFFIIGGDSLADFHRWREPEAILREVPLIVYERSGSAPASIHIAPDRLLRMWAPRLDLSGTAIRQRRAEGGSIRYMVPDAVRAYIEEHGLYLSAER